MNFHTKIILHPTDFSKNAMNALRYAGDLLQVKDARLVLLHVNEILQGSHKEKGPGVQEKIEDSEKELTIRMEAYLKECFGTIPLATVPEIQIRQHHSPYQAIQDAIVQLDPYMVVMGKRGRSAIKTSDLGSITRHLIEKIQCPLLVVPPDSTSPL